MPREGSPVIWIASYQGWLQRGSAIRPGRVVSIMAPGDAVVATPGWLPSSSHLHLGFDDVVATTDGYAAPSRLQMAQLIAFADGWTEAAPMLVHCMAGISRSSAAALIVAARRRPGREAELARRLRRVGPWFTPNETMVALADELLACDGRLREALAAMGPRSGGIDDGPVRLELT